VVVWCLLCLRGRSGQQGRGQQTRGREGTGSSAGACVDT
jgi:hypothetical protein